MQLIYNKHIAILLLEHLTLIFLVQNTPTIKPSSYRTTPDLYS